MFSFEESRESSIHSPWLPIVDRPVWEHGSQFLNKLSVNVKVNVFGRLRPAFAEVDASYRFSTKAKSDEPPSEVQ